MEDARFQKLVAVREALDRVEQAHPKSRALGTLHARLGEGLEEFRSALGLTDEQFIALGGGTPKTPPPEE